MGRKSLRLMCRPGWIQIRDEADAATVAADVTVVLGSVKRGCLTPTGASYCGQIRIADIGLGR